MKKKLINGIYAMSEFSFRIICICLLTMQIGFASNSSGQTIENTTLSLELENARLSEAFREIEEQTGYTFFYNSRLKGLNKRISVNFQDETIGEILQVLSNTTNLSFKAIDNTISVKENRMDNTSGDEAMEIINEREITGTVTDAETGETLVGVNVFVPQTTIGTTTNADGFYNFTISEETNVIGFSLMGYLAQEVIIDGRNTIDIELESDATQLDEVVVTGYGSVRRRDLTGAIVSVKTDDILNVPFTNVNQALQGRVSGVQIKQSSSAPGGDLSFVVRGLNSFMGTTDPLFVIDGIVGADINMVNPADIASIEILKDASSTAIYGSNGANGVVIINTKLGAFSEKSTINFNSHTGIQSSVSRVELLSGREWAEIDNEKQRLNGLDPRYDLNNLPADTDWVNEVAGNTAAIQNYNLSASGGQQIRYHASANYIDQQGIINNTGYQRLGFRINLDSKVGDRVKFGSRLGINRSIHNKAFGEDVSNYKGPMYHAMQLSPLLPAYDPEGNEYAAIPVPRDDGTFGLTTNPGHFQKHTTDKIRETAISGSLFTEIQLAKGLLFRPSVNYGFGGKNRGYYKSSETYHQHYGFKNVAEVGSSDSYNWNTDLLLTYRNTFGEGHNLDVLGGFVAQQRYSESINGAVEQFSLDIFEYHSLSAGEVRTALNSGLNEKKGLAYFSRINYNYKSKYLFTLNGRYEGSSIFGSDNKWGFFPSGAVAWNLSEETFIKDIGVFYNLKLRASYGISGSEALGAYSSHGRVSSFNAYNINGQPVVGFRPTTLSVPDLKWEEVSQLDIGVEASFLNGRIGFIADYYWKETSYLFLDVPLPRTSGVGSVTRNTGNLVNQGVEFTLNANVTQSKFDWRSDFNIAFQTQEVTNIGFVEEILISPGFVHGGTLQVKVGQPLGGFYGLIWDGIWQTDDLEGLSEVPTLFGTEVKPGDRRYVDISGDGNVDADDRTIIGNALPKFFGGWNNNFSYGGFEVSLFFDFVYGNDILNTDRMKTLARFGGGNRVKEYKNYWTPENQSNTIPSLTSTATDYMSSVFVEDGSYLRLRELTLGYSLPESIVSRMRLNRLNIFISASNLFTLTEYTGNNPDISVTGGTPGALNFEHGGYPAYRTITTGLNITL